MEERIHGTTLPVLELALAPGESVITESGELSWMTSSVVMQTTTAGGGASGIGGVFKRAMGGGGFFMTSYTAQGGPGMVSFAARLPGQIFPVDLVPSPGAAYMGHRHAFLCGTPQVQLGLGFQQRLGAGVFGGDGFRLQRIAGSGRAWIELSGEVIIYDLAPGEVMRVHPGHVGLFQETVSFGITTVPGIRNKLFGGDGLFLAQLQGPGRIWLQSLTIARLAHALAEYMPGQAAETGAAAGVAGALARGLFKG